MKETTRDPGQPRPEATGKGRLRALYGIGRRLLEQREPGHVIETIHRAIAGSTSEGAGRPGRRVSETETPFRSIETAEPAAHPSMPAFP